jgi:hypothetical protein
MDTDPTIVTQLTSSAVIVWVIQELKKAGWCKYLTEDTVKLNRSISAIAALASGAAINWNWDAATSSITISGLTVTAIAAFLWGALQQFIGQEVIYQAVFAPKVAMTTVITGQATTAGKVDEVVAAVKEQDGQ